MTQILDDLGFATRPHRTKGTITVSIADAGGRTPAIKADIVEEIVRIIGVDKRTGGGDARAAPPSPGPC